MTIETDLPYSDCGTDLRERTLPTSELSPTDAKPPTDAKSPTDASDQRVTVADCPACDARYYPADALARLAASTGPRRTEEGS